jgi:hypothetical protein
MRKILLPILLMFFIGTSNASDVEEDFKDDAISEDDRGIADLGIDITSKIFIYAKAVRKDKENVIVDVVILNKLCHVYFNKDLSAERVLCDGGSYPIDFIESN